MHNRRLGNYGDEVTEGVLVGVDVGAVVLVGGTGVWVGLATVNETTNVDPNILLFESAILQ